MSLEVKKQKAKNSWLFLRITCNNQCMRDFFRGWNASKNLEILKH